MIAFFCPSCGYQYQLPDDQGGTEIKCSACAERISVPLNKNTCYFKHKGKQLGPVSIEKLQQMVRSGQLSADDLVWLPTTRSWKPSREIPELVPDVPKALIAPAGPVAQAKSSGSQQQTLSCGFKVFRDSTDGVRDRRMAVFLEAVRGVGCVVTASNSVGGRCHRNRQRGI